MEYLLVVMVILCLSADSYCIDPLTSAVQSPGDTAENEPWMNPFLPRTIEPVRYILMLYPNFYFNQSVFRGHITIHFKVFNDTKTILLHKKELNITSTKLRQGCGRPVRVNRTFEYEENDYWVIQTNRPIEASSCVLTLELEFNGNLQIVGEGHSDVVFGFFKSTYHNDITGKESWYVATDLQPSNSRFVFPNFDEPRFKVDIEVRLRHWSNFTALSNMIETKKANLGSILRDTTFKKSPKMSSYLACFIISDFTSKNNTLVGGQLHRVWARPDRINKVDYALNVAPAIENYMHQELELPYRLDKLDQVALPQYSSDGAMENWGLIVYKDSTLLFDITKDGDIVRQKALSLIAHELSHNYFGNSVTCRFWNHLWLNEGFATFYEVQIVAALDPTLFYKEQHFAERLEEALAKDATLDAQPLVPDLTTPEDVETYFDTIRYDKGAAILRMLESFIAPHLFRKGIRQYLKQNENKTVVTDDLWKPLQEALNISLDLKDLMRPWIYEKGFPVITLELINSGHQINVTQKRFLIDPLDVSDKIYKWNIPLTCKTSQLSCSRWMTDNYAIFNIPMRSNDDWIQINYDMSGYYRVNYDANLWNRLTNQLNRNHMVFDELSRFKLLSDSLSLAKAEHLGYDTFLNLTRYTFKERQLAPWIIIYSGFGEISNLVSDTANFSHFQRYVLNLTSSLMDQVQVKDEGSHVEKLLRPKIMSMACSAGHRGCIENTTRLFKAWIQNDTVNAIPVNLKRDVYCIGMANSLLESEWNTVFERFSTARSEEHKNELLKALSCSRNVTMLERLLQYAIDETKMDILDSFAVIPDIVSNPASENCVWKWLKLNDTSIDEEVKSRFSSMMMRATAQTFKTREQRQEVLDFLGDTASVAKRERLLSVIDKNIRWMDRNFATVVNWLEQNAPEQSG